MFLQVHNKDINTHTHTHTHNDKNDAIIFKKISFDVKNCIMNKM